MAEDHWRSRPATCTAYKPHALYAPAKHKSPYGASMVRFAHRWLVFDDGLRRRLRIRAAEYGRSMEEKARETLRQAVGQPAPPKDLGEVKPWIRCPR